MCVCMYMCVYIYIYIYILFFIFLTHTVYYRMLNKVSCAYSRSLLVIYFIYGSESESVSHPVTFDSVTSWTVAHQAPLCMLIPVS